MPNRRTTTAAPPRTSAKSLTHPMSLKGPWASDDMDRDVAYEYRKRIGSYLSKLRTQAGMTQREVADHLGMTVSSYSGLETARWSLPPEHYATICSLFGLDTTEFASYLLRYTNPQLYALMNGVKGDPTLKADLQYLSGRAHATATEKGS